MCRFISATLILARPFVGRKRKRVITCEYRDEQRTAKLIAFFALGHPASVSEKFHKACVRSRFRGGCVKKVEEKIRNGVDGQIAHMLFAHANTKAQ